MPFIPRNQLFFTSTRGRIILLLRRTYQTVDELAQKLSLTDNAIRAHLITLERDGLICQAGIRRGSGKPAIVYGLTPEAEQHFQKAYAPVLQQLLEVLSTTISTEQIAETMQQVGQRLALQWNAPTGELHVRIQQAIDILNELGGLAELEEHDEIYIIQGYSCPLAALASRYPETCQLTKTLLTELIGEAVEEHCERGVAAHCCFTIAKP